MTATVPTTTPCPPWCTEPAGHPFDIDETGRLHQCEIGRVVITAVESRGLPCEPPMISVEAVEECNEADARQLAADLLAAADVVREGR